VGGILANAANEVAVIPSNICSSSCAAGRNASYISFSEQRLADTAFTKKGKSRSKFQSHLLIYIHKYQFHPGSQNPNAKLPNTTQSDELSNPKPQPKDTDEEVSDYEEKEEIEAPTVKKDKPNAKRVRSQALD
jgi:hypothetical protein